ncbi:type II secretion system secretin GspD [Caenimonas aquaedulcis]|uniref:Type II secretion system secretin GspD n=1 Tax=Caenimonas aquaedulcis TaxID=2793270 RepID=A0A931H690_9BURK|nr:type II secretion system secretin GspD [Caenimonas aquaedulcis]MBG9389351.1 type II secretion system secretin GspD [Caenimonas aquaedulcis]
MKSFAPSLRHTAHRIAVIGIACALATGWPAASIAQRRAEPVTLNFVNADIEAVARTMAAISGRNIVVDPRVKGTITLSTDKPVSPSAAYNQFLATLRLSGFTAVESGGLLKVVPEADAKLQGGAVSTGSPAASNQIVTQIFRLNYESAGNLVPILRPLISPNNTINVNPGNNSLVITDYADNLQRMARIIAALDISNATDVEVIPLKHALAPDLAPVVQRLVESTGSTGAVQGAPGIPQSDNSFRTTVIAEARSNTLIVRAANPARLNLVRSLVEKLDQPSSQNATGNIYVVYLKNADATKLAVTLRAALAATTGSGAGGGGTSVVSSPLTSNTSSPNAAGSNPATAPTAASASPSTGGQIQADPATNALIITAAEPQYRQIRAVIDRLDSRRAQVYVESLIAEVNADKAAEFGIQWQSPIGNTNASTVGVAGTNFSIGGTNIVSLAASPAGTVAPATGFNFGVIRNINGTYLLGFLARFLKSNGDGNILSTPNLLTLDNEEAKIVIGQNVPFVTGQYTNSNSGTNGSVNPFQTVERKDVGITLRVKPQISENGTVKMQIFQEVSSVQASSINSATGLITNKRSIESSVLVEDGGIVVIGGLLQDEYSGNDEKVPVLGDVPIFGNLFKSETRSRKKTNLMVFLRPVVIRDAAQSDALSLDRYDMMRNLQSGAQPTQSTVVPVNAAPVMPEVLKAGPKDPAILVPAPLGTSNPIKP